MFVLQITNNYPDIILWKNVSNGQGESFGLNATFETPQLSGLQTIDIPGTGSLAIFDLGATKLPGFDKIPGFDVGSGVLVRFQGEETYSRYENVGKYIIVIDSLGCATISFEDAVAVQVSLAATKLHVLG
jgi:hypothetical protein